MPAYEIRLAAKYDSNGVLCLDVHVDRLHFLPRREKFLSEKILRFKVKSVYRAS